MTDTKETNGKPVQKGPNGAIDPTANVRALVEAAVSRLDDLRDLSSIASVAAAKAEEKRVHDILDERSRWIQASVDHVSDMAAMRADYQEKLSMAESKRIDAIRSVDVNAVAVASERAAAQATVLANQVAASADALRTLVSTTASTMAAQQQVSSQQFTERLTALERSQYEGKGKQLMADPQMQELVVEMKSLRESRSTSAGKGQGINSVWVVVAGAIGLLATLLSMGALIYTLSKPDKVQPVYAPAPIQQSTPQK